MADKKDDLEINISPKTWMIIGIVAVVITLGALIYNQMQKSDASIGADTQSVKAIVNGVPIYQHEVDALKLTTMQQQAKMITDADALEQIISRKLIEQSVASEGLTPSIAEAERILNGSLAKQGQSFDSVKKQMSPEQYGKVISDVTYQLEVQHILEAAAQSINVTDDEIRATYENNKESIQKQLGNVTFQNISKKLKSVIYQQKVQNIFDQFLQKLREKAVIEYK